MHQEMRKLAHGFTGQRAAAAVALSGNPYDILAHEVITNRVALPPPSPPGETEMHRLHALPLSTLVLVAGCATLQPGAPEGQIDIIAHRGASAYAPENTLAAFERAVELRAHWFELDCLLSADGEVIVIHDANLKRTTGLDKPVGEATLAEMQALDAGTWFAPEFAGERLPTLRESLQLAKDRIGVYVEIKSAQDDAALFEQLRAAADSGSPSTPRDLRSALMPLVEANGTRNLSLARAAIRDIRALRMEKQVVIQSFSPIICLTALAEAPEIRTELLASKSADHPDRWDKIIGFGWDIDAAGFNVHHESLTEDFLQQVHGAGKTVAVWTVDDPAIMQRLAAWGVDAIITNKPDLALETVAQP